MHAENSILNHGTNRQVVEDLSEGLPKSQGIDSFTLIIKPINSINRRTFMITSKQEEILRIFDFIAKQKDYSLETLLASVNIVSQEEIISGLWSSIQLEQLNQIIELSMNISKDSQRRTQFDQNWLLRDNLQSLLTQQHYCFLCNIPDVIFALQKLLYD